MSILICTSNHHPQIHLRLTPARIAEVEMSGPWHIWFVSIAPLMIVSLEGACLGAASQMTDVTDMAH